MKVKAITEYPRPKTWKELSRFLGMAGYYRALISDYGRFTGELTKLGKKNKLFKWDGAHEKAFNKIKAAMSSSPVIRIADLSKQFIVKTDASMYGIGAVLQQEENGQRFVIEYASKAFNDCQKRYSTIEQEATAILFAIEHWQHYLLGKKFLLETDHKP